MVRLDPQLLADILDAARSLNPGDNLPPRVLSAIAEHAGDAVRFSVETGCGGSTLLLSHLSRRHQVFAIEGDNRILSRVRRSALFRADSTEFIEGPTQRTLPAQAFDAPIDLVLIDGPHAFPFPQLEYYYLYPHFRENALLILDDLQIRSIHDLFRFLQADAMFRLVEVVDRTAFFRRTAAPASDPLGDGWQFQGYNARPLLRFTWRDRLRRLRPRLGRRGWPVTIDEPGEGAAAGASAFVRGHARLDAGMFLWIFTRRADMNGWWPQGGSAAVFEGTEWRQECRFGEEIDQGHPFEIAAVAVDTEGDRRLRAWVQECERNGDYPPLQLPASNFRSVLRRVIRDPGDAKKET
jgi:hypothetical protein